MRRNIAQLLTEWKWNGMSLANPLLIAIRLVLHIPIMIVGYLLVAMLLLCGYQWQADKLRDDVL